MKILGTRSLLTLCLAAQVLTLRAEPQQILESGSFEWPPVVSRRLRSEGADVSKSAMNAEWVTFKDKPDADGGQILFGLTNKIARTGRQCMFVEFNKLTKTLASTELASDMIPILPNQSYRVAIWGRMDKERPITLAQRLPYLKLRVDWFMADQEEATGEPVWKLQPIPGPKQRKPLFVSTKWTEYFATVKSPEDAAYIKMTWYWDTTPTEGETDGVIYFDDVELTGEPGPKEDPFAEMEAEEKAAEEAAAAAAAGTPVPGAKPPAGAAPGTSAPASGGTPPANPPPAAPKKEQAIDPTPAR